MKPTLQKIQDIKNHGYHLDFGETISQTFENYKKVALLSGAVILLLSIVIGVIAGGVAILFFGLSDFAQTMTEYNAGNYSSVGLITNLVVSVIAAGLLAPIYAGLVQIAHNAETNVDFDFSTAFTHYKGKYFKDVFLATVLITFFSSGLSTLMQLLDLHFYDPTLTVIVGIVSFIVAALTPVFTFLTVPLILFGGLNATEAIGGSIKLVAKKFWVILALLLVFGICALLGLFALCIGIFFTIPIFYCAQYIIYRNAIPMEENDELDEIGSFKY